MKKKIAVAIFGLVIGIGSAVAGSTCKCSSGTMTVELHDDGSITIKCSGGGQVVCS